MLEATHYDTLDVRPSATQAEIKQSYRRLVKRFHPDSNRWVNSHDAIAQINAAYEVLGDPSARKSYDRRLGYARIGAAPATAQPKRRRRTGRDSDEELQQWLRHVYQPVNRQLSRVLVSLQGQIDDLAADPFDDELLEDFQIYLESCREAIAQAQRSFQSMPNPSNVAGAAANLYYCLSQLGDGVDELERFTMSYSEHYLHTGQELFRIASGLRREAQDAIRNLT
jgi:molecular chaperone DnaJ